MILVKIVFLFGIFISPFSLIFYILIFGRIWHSISRECIDGSWRKNYSSIKPLLRKHVAKSVGNGFVSLVRDSLATHWFAEDFLAFKLTLFDASRLLSQHLTIYMYWSTYHHLFMLYTTSIISHNTFFTLFCCFVLGVCKVVKVFQHKS